MTIRPSPHHFPIDVDGWMFAPPERQVFPMDCTVSMTLVHFDIAILETAMANSMQSSSEGVDPIGGTLLGANSGYKTLTLSSPGPANNTFTFTSAYIKDSYELPLGAERSLLQVTFHCVGYRTDPYGSTGIGAQGVIVYS